MHTESFKKKLTEEKTRLESELGALGRRNPAVPGDWEPVAPADGAEADILDQAEALSEREANAAVLADFETRYRAVAAALARIDAGTYGTCAVCGAKIEPPRLDADPAASTCAAHR